MGRHLSFRILICIWLICCPFLLAAQIPYARSLTTKDGLPSNKVYCATQDHSGFIWFGTDNGLVRYDGAKFKSFTVKEGLPDNDVFSVFEDGKQRLWVLTFKQAPCYYYQGKLFTALNDSFLAKNFKNPNLYRFSIQYGSGRIVFTINENGKVKVLEKDQPEFIFPLKNAVQFAGEYVKMLKGENHTTYIIRDLAANSRTHKLQTLYKDTSVIYTDFLLNGREAGFGVWPDHGKWHILQNSGDTLKTVIRGYDPGIARCYASTSGELYFIYNSGEIGKLNLRTLLPEKMNVKIPSGTISTMCIDNNGGIWVCTMDNGIYYFPGNGAEMYQSGGTEIVNALAVLPGQNTLYAGCENKSIFSIENGKESKTIPLQSLYVGQRITALAVFKNTVVIGGDFGTIFRMYNGKQFEPPSQDLSRRNVKDAEPDRHGNLLIGSAHGAGVIDVNEYKTVELFWHTRTTAVNEHTDGHYYLGTVNGLYRYVKATKLTEQIKTGTDLDKARVTDIKSDLSGRLWVGTAQFGLFVRDGSKWIHFTDNHALCNITSYFIKNIFVDDQNIVWVGTDKGLNRIQYLSRNQCDIKKITKSIGLPDNNINASVVIHDTIYVATSMGVSRFLFTPNKFSEIPGLEITSVLVNFKPIATDKLAGLDYKNNNISIEFTAISFRSSDNILYRYRLDGSDNSWIQTQSTRIDLLALKPGKYIFQVEAINVLTGEKSRTLSIPFVIQKPWYNTWSFFGLMAFLIAGFIFWIFLFRTKKIKRDSEKENKRNKQMAELEMQALRSQMNPHFIFNALSAIQNYFVLKKEEAANAYMTRFARLIRQMMEYSKNNFISLHEEIDLLNNYLHLEKLRFEDKMDYRIEVDKNIDIVNYKIPSLILQPLLENAVNHGIRPMNHSGLVLLRIHKDDQFLTCTVSDNGVGMEAGLQSKETGIVTHISKGLKILQSRIENINIVYHTKIKIDFMDKKHLGNGQTGTEIQIYFPLTFVTDLEKE